ncbi:MAG: aconitate hydratase, partial [Hyphomonadaceae bacterium]|nr:aconitate hydratase [Hyphomonadaceae bacterium]
YLKDLWPSDMEVSKAVDKFVTTKAFKKRYADVFKGDRFWRSIKTKPSLTYAWDDKSTYVRNPPYFDGMSREPEPVSDIAGARCLVMVGDSVTTDHISPAGDIAVSGPAGKYLRDRQVPVSEFNSYGARRGNHEVMMRGTFANIRIKNHLVPGVEGGVTKHFPDGGQQAIYDAAMKYVAEKTPLVIFAGKEYGTGSSRDWAAKGTRLLGVRAVVAESFERIHRSNLIGMGVLPLQFADGVSWKSLTLTGAEIVEIGGIAGLLPRQVVSVDVTYPDGAKRTFEAKVRIDTENELDYFRNGGILHYVLRSLAKAS